MVKTQVDAAREALAEAQEALREAQEALREALDKEQAAKTAPRNGDIFRDTEGRAYVVERRSSGYTLIWVVSWLPGDRRESPTHASTVEYWERMHNTTLHPVLDIIERNIGQNVYNKEG